MQSKLLEDKRANEYLANERTFLAWIRTSIAIISLGFVVAKFSLWLHELAAQLHPQIQAYKSGASMPIGISMMAMGGLLTGLAAWRYHTVNLSIAEGRSGLLLDSLFFYPRNQFTLLVIVLVG